MRSWLPPTALPTCLPPSAAHSAIDDPRWPHPAGFGFDYDERDKYLGGYVAAAFYLVGAPSALLFGYLSDKVNRRNLLFVAVLIGEWCGMRWW